MDSSTNKEWLVIKYGKKTKKMQRFCSDLKAVVTTPNTNETILPSLKSPTSEIYGSIQPTTTRRSSAVIRSSKLQSKLNDPRLFGSPQTITTRSRMNSTSLSYDDPDDIDEWDYDEKGENKGDDNEEDENENENENQEEEKKEEQQSNENDSKTDTNDREIGTSVGVIEQGATNTLQAASDNYSVGIIAGRDSTMTYRDRVHRSFYLPNIYNTYSRLSYGYNTSLFDQNETDEIESWLKVKPAAAYTVQHGWISLTRPHFQILPASNLVAINKNEFALATEVVLGQQSAGIYTYNTLNNEWKLIWSYPFDIPYMKHSAHNLAVDYDRNELYLYGTQEAPHSNQALIVILNLNSFKHKLVYIPRSYTAPAQVLSVIMNDEYHIIGKCRRPNYGIYDIKNKKFRLNSSMRPYFTYNKGGLYGVLGDRKENKMMVMVGSGYEKLGDRNEGYDEIWGHGLDKSEWKKICEIKTPNLLKNFGFVITFDMKYVMIFGGGGKRRSVYDEIYVLSLESGKIYGCDIRCPMIGEFDAVMMSAVSSIGAIDLVNGYIKKYIFEINVDEEEVWVPMDIVNLLAMFCKNEYIHLLPRRDIFAKHWKICVDDIMRAMKPLDRK